VSPAVRRRRGLLLLALALASGALAASLVRDRVESVERRVGPLVPVAVAARDLRAGARLAPRDVAVRRVPAAYAPRRALGSPAQAVGHAPGVALPAGAYLTPELLGGSGEDRTGGGLPRGQRAVEVAVAGGGALESAGPGSRVDVLVSTEANDGRGSTSVALENVELLAIRPAGAEGSGLEAGGGPEEGPAAAAAVTAVATLRVTLRQALYLTAAQNFAREVRLLPRPAGDTQRAGRAAIGSGDL
jgi:pilus assembly protein CpaB